MTNNFFEPQEVNLQVQPLPTYIDSDGVFKINTPMLATYNFDGLIPKYDGAISASAVKPGYLIQLDTGGQYYPVVSVESDDDVLESTGLVTINYIDNLGNTNSESYGETDQVNVIYENWAEKIVGSQGWGITSGGNAIFTNVAVRGDLEATTMDIGGPTGITYDGSTVIIGASVVVNAPITFNGVTQEELSASLSGYIPDGQAANDININSTTIDGGKITTGSITADKIDVNNLIARNLITSTSGPRVEVTSACAAYIRMFTGLPFSTELNPAYFLVEGSSTGTVTTIQAPIWKSFFSPPCNIKLRTGDNGSSIWMEAPTVNFTGNIYMDGGNVIGNLQGNATNISQYLINQNLSTGSDPQFRSVIGPQSIEMRQIAIQGASPGPSQPPGNYRGGTLWIVV